MKTPTFRLLCEHFHFTHTKCFLLLPVVPDEHEVAECFVIPALHLNPHVLFWLRGGRGRGWGGAGRSALSVRNSKKMSTRPARPSRVVEAAAQLVQGPVGGEKLDSEHRDRHQRV